MQYIIKDENGNIIIVEDDGAGNYYENDYRL
jgi:hypothetical protein